MSLRCKVGDLAVTVRSMEGKQNGRLVEVIRPATPADVAEWEPGSWYVRVLGGPLYMIGQGGKVQPFTYCVLRDSNLRPIRPGDVADESLGWKEVPAPKDAKALIARVSA